MENALSHFRPLPLRIGNVVVDPPLILAPMAGVTDGVYRRVMAEHGAGMVTTEMLSVEGLRRSQRATWRLFVQDPGVRVPVAVQIFGSDPQAAAEAARMVETEGASLVDINAGCPVRKVIRQGAGADLLRHPDRLAAIVEAVRKAVSIPVTVKIRSGWDYSTVNAEEVARRVASAGADAITLHARTAAQHYGGTADWSVIRRVKRVVNIPVIGNGDVDCPSRADGMMGETGCDAVMIGRASQGNPWLFSAIADRWGCAAGSRRVEDWTDYFETVRAHVEAFRVYRSVPVGHLRMLFLWYSKGCPDSARLRAKLTELAREEDLMECFRTWVQEVMLKGIPFLALKVAE